MIRLPDFLPGQLNRTQGLLWHGYHCLPAPAAGLPAGTTQQAIVTFYSRVITADGERWRESETERETERENERKPNAETSAKANAENGAQIAQTGRARACCLMRRQQKQNDSKGDDMKRLPYWIRSARQP